MTHVHRYACMMAAPYCFKIALGWLWHREPGHGTYAKCAVVLAPRSSSVLVTTAPRKHRAGTGRHLCSHHHQELASRSKGCDWHRLSRETDPEGVRVVGAKLPANWCDASCAISCPGGDLNWTCHTVYIGTFTCRAVQAAVMPSSPILWRAAQQATACADRRACSNRHDRCVQDLMHVVEIASLGTHRSRVQGFHWRVPVLHVKGEARTESAAALTRQIPGGS